jgi:hypothetical protein
MTPRTDSLEGELFFLSYAHPGPIGRQRPSEVVKFFDDLSENVAELVSRPAGSDPGYMDTLVPKSGRPSDHLLAVLGSCQVFVALISERYLTSESCAMEWSAFAQRQVILRQDGTISMATAIIPVIWAPVRPENIPPAIAEIQWFQPRDMPYFNLSERYRSEGIFGLQKVDEDAYETVVWRLAQSISEVYYANYVIPREFGVANLHNIFKITQ